MGDLSGSCSLPTPILCNTSRTSSNEQLVPKMKPSFPLMYAFNLSNPALGQSLRPICTPFRITVFLPHRTSSPLQKEIRKEAFPPASCTGSANETVGLASPAGKVTVPFEKITCSATAKVTSLPARPMKGLPLESSTALASIRMYTVLICACEKTVVFVMHRSRHWVSWCSRH